MWFHSFMNCTNMSFQITLYVTTVVTNWAFMWFLFFVNYISMFVHVYLSCRALHLSKMPVFTQISNYFVKSRLRAVCTVPFFMCLMINHIDTSYQTILNITHSINMLKYLFSFLSMLTQQRIFFNWTHRLIHRLL